MQQEGWLTSLQFRVLGFSLLEDGDVGVGVFPVKSQNRGLDNQGRNTGQEIFVSGERTNAAASASAPCDVFASSAFARATPNLAKSPVQQFHTMPL